MCFKQPFSFLIFFPRAFGLRLKLYMGLYGTQQKKRQNQVFFFFYFNAGTFNKLPDMKLAVQKKDHFINMKIALS